MPHLFKAQVSLNRVGGMAADVVTNTMHFDGDEGFENPNATWEGQGAGLTTRLIAFYQNIGANYGGQMAGTGTIKLYDMQAPVPRVPRLTTNFTHGVGGSGLPSEVALCLSFRAETLSGVNARRRRGRIFLGPFTTGASTMVAGSSDYRPLAALRQQIVTAFVTMATGTNGAARLAIYSPTNDAAGSVEDAFEDAREVWCDDAWDTIRSRGARPLSRITASIAP